MPDTFVVYCNEELSKVHTIKTRVVQGRILAPILYNIYIADILQTNNTSLATSVNDTRVISSNLDINLATKNLQERLLKLQHLFKL